MIKLLRADVNTGLNRALVICGDTLIRSIVHVLVKEFYGTRSNVSDFFEFSFIMVCARSQKSMEVGEMLNGSCLFECNVQRIVQSLGGTYRSSHFRRC